MKRVDMFQFPASALDRWEFATVSLYKPFKNSLLVGHSLLGLVDASPVASKARCSGHPSLSHGSLRSWCARCGIPNPAFLKEKLGVVRSLPIVCHLTYAGVHGKIVPQPLFPASM